MRSETVADRELVDLLPAAARWGCDAATTASDGRTDGRRTRAGGHSSNAGGENIIPAAAAAAAKTARRQGVPATRRFAESCCSTGSERPHRCCHLVRAGSAGTSESTPQTARRSVQPLWQGSRMYPTDTRTTEHR